MADGRNDPAPVSGSAGPDAPEERVDKPRPPDIWSRLLAAIETTLLRLVSFVLLASGLGVLVSALVRAVTDQASWTETFIDVLQEMLLVLIIVEIFITVQAHLNTGRLRLEPFIVVGIIAVVRHILSIVVRLTVPETSQQIRDRLTELAVDAGAAFLLVAALALARWSQRRPGR